MREIKMKVYTSGGMIGPFDLSQHPMYWSHKLRDGERLLYTGLKDKNGVEVYEGDVIRYHGSKLGEVVWECDYKQLGYYLKVDGELRRVLNPIENYALEVIGNIYENSELLEESK